MTTRPIDLFRRLTSGVFVVGATHGGVRDAFTAAWIGQVSFDPLLISLSVNPQHATWPLIARSGTFAVSVLKQGQTDLVRHFGTRSGREVDKLAGIALRPEADEPVLADALAWLRASVVTDIPAGDHRLVVARVTAGAVLDEAAEPLRYGDTGNIDGSAALYPPAF